MNNTQDNKNPEKTHDLHYYAGHIQYDMTNLIKWLLLAVLTGLTVGFISSLFARALKFVTTYRTEHFWVFFLLPAAGLVIVFLYQIGKRQVRRIAMRNSDRTMAAPIRYFPPSAHRMTFPSILLR